MLFFVLLLNLSFAQFDNLDEMIRYQEDPDYAEYLERKEKQRILQKQAVKEQRELRKKNEINRERARLEHIKKRDKKRKKKEKEEAKHYKEFTQQRRQRREEHLQNQKAYYTSKAKEERIFQEQREEQLARMREKVDRMPASKKEDRPRSPRDKRRWD